MTNEEREALIAQGWTPPVAVDPDVNMARDYAHYLLGTIFEIPSFQRAQDYFLQAIKRGRELERVEAKAGVVWIKHDGSDESPVNKNWFVAIFRRGEVDAGRARLVDWRVITHYAVITPPAEDVA